MFARYRKMCFHWVFDVWECHIPEVHNRTGYLVLNNVGSEHRWFASYICNRMQFCRVNSVSSGLDDIHFGVLWGF